MKPAEMERILKTITLIVDTREQQTPEYKKRIKAVGYPYRRQALKFGDYSGEYTKDGKVYSLTSEFAIERKMSLDEICGNFGKGRRRFNNEFTRAAEAGAKMHLIVENGNYEKIIAEKYRSKFNGNSLMSSIIAFCDRYNLTMHFCTPETTPIIINKLLYHHVRNKLMSEVEV